MLGEFFDPTDDVLIHERVRPHWSQSGAVVFVTFRTKDSIPKSVLQRWNDEKNDWLDRRGLLQGQYWATVVPTLEQQISVEFFRQFNRCREDFLDTCQGSCPLRDPQLAKIVADSLLYFDGERYTMGDFVVMPNHVHLLAAFANADVMATQFASWLHYTVVRINKLIGKKGHFWQQEPFDHLVRNAEQYEYLRKYIADNPLKARLQPGEYLYYKYDDQ